MKQVKEASRVVASADDAVRSDVLRTLATLIEDNTDDILSANSKDLALMDKNNPLYDRLQLTSRRLADIAADMRHVADLPCPLDRVIEQRTLANGIDLRKVSVPFGVIGVIYEARPNVTYDVFSLCLKSGNACVLKGGHDAEHSNIAAIELIHRALKTHSLPESACKLMPSTHDATAQLLSAVGLVDVVIPRGGRRLIDFVRQNAKIPVIETGAGVVHAYVDRAADIDMASRIIHNAKTRRVSVCNALDAVLMHSALLDKLAVMLAPLAAENVEIHADSRAYAALAGSYPDKLLLHATDADPDTEYMDYKMGLYTVDDIKGAIAHIARHGSGHSETIITADSGAASLFQRSVDAACVYHNLPTSFTDGAQFELGAEIGISTQKLGPRGPMGLREITTYKYLLTGSGQLRPR